jgi:DNA-binding response OmpR family regulator
MIPGMTRTGRVLVADDEEALRRLLRAYLAREGLDVVEADNGLDALAHVRRGDVDVALLDVMMPGLDGFELVRRIRASSSIPVILLTARGEEASRVAGLEIGADDYVVKPFSAPEVVARVRAQLRRRHGLEPQRPPLRAGGVELDVEARRCLVDGREVVLTRRQFDLLATLMENAGRACSRERLLHDVWGSEYLEPKTVDVHVAALRRALGAALRITTLRGVGYRLEA